MLSMLLIIFPSLPAVDEVADDADVVIEPLGIFQAVFAECALEFGAQLLLFAEQFKAAPVPQRMLAFMHRFAVDAADGRRMAKRLNSLDLGTLRERGADPREVLGYCAWLLRVIDEPRPVGVDELVERFSWGPIAADRADRVVSF